MTEIRLVNPIGHAGGLHRSILIRRPGPVQFFRYWRRRHLPGPPPFRVSLPWTVVDRLHPADHRRVIVEMTRLANRSSGRSRFGMFASEKRTTDL